MPRFVKKGLSTSTLSEYCHSVLSRFMRKKSPLVNALSTYPGDWRILFCPRTHVHVHACTLVRGGVNKGLVSLPAHSHSCLDLILKRTLVSGLPSPCFLLTCAFFGIIHSWLKTPSTSRHSFIFPICIHSYFYLFLHRLFDIIFFRRDSYSTSSIPYSWTIHTSIAVPFRYILSIKSGDRVTFDSPRLGSLSEMQVFVYVF